jgi:hypothetical protein
MSRAPTRQLGLFRDAEALWNQLPQERRERCRELISQLLGHIVTAEQAVQGAKDERADPIQSS